MGLFNRVNKPALATEYGAIEITAAVGGSNVGASQVGNYIAYTDGTGRERMMSLAVIARARDLICTTISGMKFEMYREMWNGDEMEEVPLAPRAWLARMDKGVPNSTLLSWLADDLIFCELYEVAFRNVSIARSAGTGLLRPIKSGAFQRHGN